jgi:putative ABC transport system permease protein
MRKNATPPRLANALFSWYCKNASIEDLEGDLEEIFIQQARSMPLWKARLYYWKMVFSLIFSYSIKKRKKQASYHAFSTANPLDLFLNYFKVSWRSLAKNRFFTIINVLGLAVGMSISLLFIAMFSYVSTYDTFHEKRDRIYRITTTSRDESRVYNFASSPSPLAEKIKDEFPAIEHIVRMSKTLSGNALTDKKEIPLSGYFVDDKFFSLFTFHVRKGNAATALSKPMSIVLTASAARKAFGSEEALGKSIVIEPWGNFEVTAVMEDHPKASHLNFEALASYSTLHHTQLTQNSWHEFRNQYTYMLLSPSADPTSLEAYLKKISVPNLPAGKTVADQYSLQSINDVTPGKEYANEIGPTWDYLSFTIFGFLNLLILLPACFNYANISISRTLKRAKEIGLRKTVGGQRSQIFTQFITETVIVTLIALGGAFLIFTQIRGQFLEMLVSADGLELNADPVTILYFIAFSIVTGVVAGIIPAVYLSKLNPVQALKNTASLKSMTGLSFQKVLVVSQFALSLGFIMAVVIVLKQYRSSLNYNFGFEQANILDVDLQDADPSRFRNEFSKLASVKSISMSSGIVGASGPEETTIARADAVEDSIVVHQFFADAHYADNLKIDLVAGKFFPETTSGKTEKYIVVNEEFLKSYKISSAADALGQSFVLDDSVETQIIGVVKNFHYTSLREPIRSFIFRNDESRFRFANMTISSTDIYSSVGEMEDSWKAIGTTTAFRSRFLSDEIQDTYSFYFSMVKICGFLGFLAITISCLGLLGMVVYTTENRMKELGIRKVMGATSYQLAVLLSKGYLKLMLVAAIIATPVTYIIFDKGMLQVQYYRFDIGAAEIIISLAIMLFLGGLTILSQTLKASTSNPVDTLKSE